MDKRKLRWIRSLVLSLFAYLQNSARDYKESEYIGQIGVTVIELIDNSPLGRE